MDRGDEIQEKIRKTEQILQESIENLKNNPGDYSAKLLVLSTENYLGDLYRQLEMLGLDHRGGGATHST